MQANYLSAEDWRPWKPKCQQGAGHRAGVVDEEGRGSGEQSVYVWGALGGLGSVQAPAWSCQPGTGGTQQCLRGLPPSSAGRAGSPDRNAVNSHFWSLSFHTHPGHHVLCLTESPNCTEEPVVTSPSPLPEQSLKIKSNSKLDEFSHDGLLTGGLQLCLRCCTV